MRSALPDFRGALTPPPTSRRRFVQTLAAGVGAAFLPPYASLFGQNLPPEPPPFSPQGKLGVALLGLGRYSTNQLAPALQETQYCRLTGIVTGTPAKAQEWSNKYKLPAKSVYNYENFDHIADNRDIDIVYVVTPNALHADFVIRAAKAGKHVICEKPMATTVEDCQRMIDACERAKRQLSIGYRLHFDPYNLEMMRLAQEKVFGPVQHINAEDGQVQAFGTWRTDPKLAGGGPLMDVGIYCVQGACYVSGEVPIAVTAHDEKKDPEKFKDIEETLHYTLEFPSGVKADCVCSYSERLNRLRAEAPNGWFELSPAYGYRGLKGQTSKGPMNFPTINQQAVQMDAFAQAVMQGVPSIVPGEMGLRDVKILMATYEAMRSGKRVEIKA